MKNLLKIFPIIGITISIIGVLSFTLPENSARSKKLIVTSNAESTFDCCIISDKYPGGRKDFKGLTTPFEMNIKATHCKILLKKVSGNNPVNFKVKDKTSSIEGNWPTTVILINKERMETFGL